MKRIRLLITICALMLFGLSMTVSAHEHEGHDYYKFYSLPNTGDAYYHTTTYYCRTCYTYFKIQEPHDALRWMKDIDESYYGCPICGYKECEVSDSEFQEILGYKNSKKLVLKFYGKLGEGDQIKVKVAGKVYKKTVDFELGDDKITFKIKKPAKNYKVKAWVVHAGKQICIRSDYIKTSTNPQKGMTPQQVKKYTRWNVTPDEKKGSNGYTYWIWYNGVSRKDASYIAFKHGKVIKWHGHY